MRWDRVAGGIAEGLGTGLVAQATADIDARRQENLIRLQQKFAADQAGADRDFRREMSDRDAAMTREGWDRADRRASAGRAPSSRFTSTMTGADGNLYGLTRDGKMELIQGPDGAGFAAATKTPDPVKLSSSAIDTATRLVDESEEAGAMTPQERALAINDLARRIEVGDGGRARAAPEAAPTGAPKVGDEVADDEGVRYRFKGGDPSDEANWTPVAEAKAEAPADEKPAAGFDAADAGGPAREPATPMPPLEGARTVQIPDRVLSMVETAGGLDNLIDSQGRPKPSAMVFLRSLAATSGMTLDEMTRRLHQMRSML